MANHTAPASMPAAIAAIMMPALVSRTAARIAKATNPIPTEITFGALKIRWSLVLWGVSVWCWVMYFSMVLVTRWRGNTKGDSH